MRRLRWGAVLVLLSLAAATLADEAEVAKALEKAGGTVRVDDKQPDKPVVTVILWGPTFKGEMLKDLRQFKKLENLRIGGPWITDEGVKELKELKTLKLLEIRSPKVTDAGLKDLQEALPKLKITRASPGTGEIK
jgi:hypothetical protein